MIVHIVSIKCKDFADAEGIKEALEALPAQIPEIQSYELGLDFLRSERSYDLVLVSEFLTREDLAVYSQHPAHIKVVEELIKPCLAGIAVVDYEK